MRRIGAPFVLGLSIAIASPAFAQSATNDAAAQQFFDEGRALMRDSRYAEACAKFDASDRLSPAGGTLLNLADCYEKAGKTASAWAKYNEAADRAIAAHKPDAETFARDRARALAGKLAYVTIAVAPAATATEGIVVKLDGAALDESTWNTALPIDPGAHDVEASAPGKKTQAMHTVIAPATRGNQIHVEAFDDGNAQPATTPPSPAPPIDEPPPSSASENSGTTQRVLGISVAALGVVGLGIGTAFGIAAKNKHDRVDDDCSNGGCINVSDLTDNSDSKTDATASTIAFIAGGVLVAGGVVLYLTAPNHDKTSAVRIAPSFSANGGHLLLQGTF